jgi:hypothetical protein
MDHRAAARLLAAGRVAVGAGLLVLPGRVAGVWLGDESRTPAAKVLARAMGVRDLVLGLGVLQALDRGDAGARQWVQASAVADVGDATAVLLAYRRLPRRRRFMGFVVAAGAAAAGFVVAEHLD